MKPPPGTLSIEKLINLIETTWMQFSDQFVPLTHTQVKSLKKCSRLVAIDPSTIQKNAPKLRAHTILTDILGSSEELFFLCALSIYPYNLGKLKSENYLRGLVEWKQDKSCPKGLRDAITHYYALFPKKKTLCEWPRVTLLRFEGWANIRQILLHIEPYYKKQILLSSWKGTLGSIGPSCLGYQTISTNSQGLKYHVRCARRSLNSLLRRNSKKWWQSKRLRNKGRCTKLWGAHTAYRTGQRRYLLTHNQFPRGPYILLVTLFHLQLSVHIRARYLCQPQLRRPWGIVHIWNHFHR